LKKIDWLIAVELQENTSGRAMIQRRLRKQSGDINNWESKGYGILAITNSVGICKSS